ncbi:hypothetical protein GGF46_002994 [Coemansia sp. RSA 552]|nr:hypothetical protein GGF46_002994 [Coemansia sp. RSA 552]
MYGLLARAAALAILGVHLRLAVSSTNTPQLRVFGDSLSDTGRLKELTHELAPPSAYWNGRFCNAPIYSELLASLLRMRLDSHAVGMAKTAVGPDRTIFGKMGLEPPTSEEQIARFATDHPGFNQTAGAYQDIAVLEIGSNDAIGFLGERGSRTIYEFADQLSTTVVQQLQQLYRVGFRQLLAVNLPALDLAPKVIGERHASNAAVLVATYNRMLADKAHAWADTVSLGFLGVVDLGEFVKAALQPTVAGALGITDTRTFCLRGAWLALFNDRVYFSNIAEFLFSFDSGSRCSDPASFFFFDPIHPTGRVQWLFGCHMSEHIKALRSGRMPEKPTTHSLLALIAKCGLWVSSK